MSDSTLTAAQAFLARLGQLGVPYLFANSGTDFAPIIEAYESASDSELAQWPRPLTIVHETVALGMAHGAYLLSGLPQAAMVHVNVGLANSLMGLINAQSENIPLLMFAGRTPITEYQRPGARMTPIQYGQEMRDQAGMLRDLVKWDYELRYGEQIVDAVDRAFSIACSSPQGPVFLGLPREPLAETLVGGRTLSHPLPPQVPQNSAPDEVINAIARLIASAKFPLIICQRGDHQGRLGAAITKLCSEHSIAVVEPFVIRNLVSSAHPSHLGYQLNNLLDEADCLIVIESPVPWIQRFMTPNSSCSIIHIAEDPLFSNLPMRSFPASLLVCATAHLVIDQISEALRDQPSDVVDRQAVIDFKKSQLEASRAKLVAQHSASLTISPAMVAIALEPFLATGGIVFSELGPPPDLARPVFANQWFTPPYSGGLGWGVPAAIGAKLASPNKRIVACIGDGSYIFANPVACNHVMASLNLPVLVIVLNNSSWNATRRAAHNMYPYGAAAKAENPVLTSLTPSPDFTSIASANGGWAKSVSSRLELSSAIEEAFDALEQGRCSATLEVLVSKTDGF